MITLLIILIAVVLFFAKGTKESYWDGITITGIGWITALTATFFLLYGFGYGLEHQKKTEFYAQSELGSLQDQSNIQGRFFLGSGTIDEKPAYSYYKKIGDNQYQLRQLVDDGGTPIVVFEDSDKPYVKTVHTKSDGYFGAWGFMWGHESLDQFEFHVPKGSIVQNVTLDAKD